MKIKYIVKIEKETGKPILFFPDNIDHTRHGPMITCYTLEEQHNESSREYYRKGCYFPKTSEEMTACAILVTHYSNKRCGGKNAMDDLVPVKRVRWCK